MNLLAMSLSRGKAVQSFDIWRNAIQDIPSARFNVKLYKDYKWTCKIRHQNKLSSTYVFFSYSLCSGMAWVFLCIQVRDAFLYAHFDILPLLLPVKSAAAPPKKNVSFDLSQRVFQSASLMRTEFPRIGRDFCLVLCEPLKCG